MSIEIRRLGFSYGSTDVLHDITFTAADGDIAAVLGPNGVGKSTLFRCVLGFLVPRRARSPISRSRAFRPLTIRCSKSL